MQTAPSTFMLVFRETSPETYAAMTTEQRREALRKWNGWCDDLAARGRLQSGHPLEPAGRVVSGPGGSRVLDGPFAEAKEFIGGYFLIAADSLDDATEIAREAPSLPFGMTVEVREVASGCHLAKSLGLEGMREPAHA